MKMAGALSVSTVLVRALVETVERAGVGREALLHGTAIELGRLGGTIDRFDLDDFARLQERALDLTGDEALGLHMAERATEAAYDLVAHLVAHAPTLHAAIDLCSRFERLFIDGAHVHLRQHGGIATIHLEFVRTSPRADRMLAEFAVTALMRMIQVFGQAGTRAGAAYFEHASPEHRREYARLFFGAERFSQGFTGIEFDGAILDRPQLHQHALLSTVLMDHAQQQLDQVGREPGLTERLEQYLLARAPSRIPDMRTAARHLGTSVRSLRRRLTDAGFSYRALVQSTLERSAKRMLRDPRCSVQETADALGFADPAAFSRAFKRWTGLTPLEFRQPK
jgi:AraC-like DNA-binding protein